MMIKMYYKGIELNSDSELSLSITSLYEVKNDYIINGIKDLINTFNINACIEKIADDFMQVRSGKFFSNKKGYNELLKVFDLIEQEADIDEDYTLEFNIYLGDGRVFEDGDYNTVDISKEEFENNITFKEELQHDSIRSN